MPDTFFKSFKITSLLLISLIILGIHGCKKADIKTDASLSTIASKDQSSSQRINIPGYVVDQSNVALPDSNSYNIYLAPMGQQFTPTLYALDAIELKVSDASCSIVGSSGGSLRLNLREATITGKIIGTTEAMHFPNCFHGILRFNFPAFIPVTPGQVYVMEAIHVSGNTSVLYMNESPDNYNGGDFIMNGTVKTGKDLWFREGLFNFIARNKEQIREIGWQNLVRHNGTPFRNQGDCMQYINTGR
jgi:hypothetical protein